MKAKELANQYNLLDKEGKEKFIVKTLHSMFIEIPKIIDQRGVKKNSAVLSVFREQESRWKAFTKRIETDLHDKKETLFVWYLETQYPDIFKIWESLESKSLS